MPHRRSSRSAIIGTWSVRLTSIFDTSGAIRRKHSMVPGTRLGSQTGPRPCISARPGHSEYTGRAERDRSVVQRS